MGQAKNLFGLGLTVHSFGPWNHNVLVMFIRSSHLGAKKISSNIKPYSFHPTEAWILGASLMFSL